MGSPDDSHHHDVYYCCFLFQAGMIFSIVWVYIVIIDKNNHLSFVVLMDSLPRIAGQCLILDGLRAGSRERARQYEDWPLAAWDRQASERQHFTRTQMNLELCAKASTVLVLQDLCFEPRTIDSMVRTTVGLGFACHWAAQVFAHPCSCWSRCLGIEGLARGTALCADVSCS